jgi:LysM repeat protein
MFSKITSKNKVLSLLVFVLVLGLTLNGCISADPVSTSIVEPSSTLIWQGKLEPYSTGTPTTTPLPPTPMSALPITPAPTSTPFTHIIQKDETMLGIAIRYGITLDDLKAANPEADPRMLSIGQVLIIPLMSQEAAIENAPTATPVPVRLGQPACYPAGDGGLNCFLEVFNDQAELLESVSVWFGLYNQNDSLVASQVGNLTLNFLTSGGNMPVSAYFSPPVPADSMIRTQLVSALTVIDDTTRYVKTDVTVEKVQIDPNGLQASAAGSVAIMSPVRAIWGVALAYDLEREIIGIRRWKQDTGCLLPELVESTPEVPTSTPAACGPLPFEITVFSLGPQIETVEILAEARP